MGVVIVGRGKTQAGGMDASPWCVPPSVVGRSCMARKVDVAGCLGVGDRTPWVYGRVIVVEMGRYCLSAGRTGADMGDLIG